MLNAGAMRRSGKLPGTPVENQNKNQSARCIGSETKPIAFPEIPALRVLIYTERTILLDPTLNRILWYTCRKNLASAAILVLLVRWVRCSPTHGTFSLSRAKRESARRILLTTDARVLSSSYEIRGGRTGTAVGLIVIIILPILHIHISPFPEVCDSHAQGPHYRFISSRGSIANEWCQRLQSNKVLFHYILTTLVKWLKYCHLYYHNDRPCRSSSG
jgi:hypothetical protein